MKWLQGASLMVVLCTNIQAQDVYYLRGTGSPPWGSFTNDVELDTVFGQGNWALEFYQTVNVPTLLQYPQTQYIYMEGGALHDAVLRDFLDSNIVEIENWVAAGGRLFINSAGWLEDTIHCGFDSTLIFLGQYVNASDSAYAYQNSHVIFNCPYQPVDTHWTGGYFSHSTILGNNLDTLIINNFTDSLIICAKKIWGIGEVMFGGMTTTNWHNPSPSAENLRQNMHAYMYSNITNYYCSNIIGTTSISCFDSCNGFATVSAGGGFPPYTYLWDDPSAQTSTSATGLCAGTYSVTITDDSLNTLTESWTIGSPPNLISFVFTVTPPTNGCNGTAKAGMVGGASPFSFLWGISANSQITQTAYNLCVGNYCVTVTDANYCTKDSCVDVLVGIDEYDKSKSFYLFPNPTDGFATITNTEQGITNVEVYDIFGRPVPFQFDIGRSLLDVRSSPAGVYFVKAGETVRKLIKQ